MFIAAAGINALWGISALVNEKYFSVDKLLFGDLAMWGAIYVTFAVIFVALGLLILLGSTLGIMLGAVIAVLHGWTALLTIGAYPLWAGDRDRHRWTDHLWAAGPRTGREPAATSTP
jgi:hypothetical protein